MNHIVSALLFLVVAYILEKLLCSGDRMPWMYVFGVSMGFFAAGVADLIAPLTK